MKKRLLSLFLCAVMIFGFVPGLAAAAKDTGLNIYCDDEQVSNIELPEKTPVTVKALLSESTAGSFQWQIRVSNGVWANIIGSSDNALTLRYAMVANLLNEDGQAVVRCRFTPVDGKAIYSNELTVQMVSDMALMTIAAAEENSFTFTVLDPGSVVIHDTAKEPEKTPAPTETPASEESAAPSEEPAPTEEPAAPTEEPAPAEESAAPADPAEESAAPAEESVAPAEESAAETETFSLVSFLGLDSFGLKAYADEGESTPDVKTTYSVVINYKFENNQQVADSYVATLAEGSPFSATVNFPTVQGYLPYVNDERQNSYEINIASVSEDVTINVVYKPTNVDYTVIHYQQNVDNDMYREVERETKQGLTNSQVPESAKSYEGFYSLIYERPNIAADGSTVIEVYYDRYYYLMTFDLDGGYGVEPIYARFGAPISVDTPTKPGYTFEGWDKTIPATMPAQNTSYKASWKIGTSGFTVLFWYENANDNGYSVAGTYTPANVDPGTEKKSEDYKDQSFTGRDDKHFTYNAAKAETVTVKGDGSTVLNVYYTRNTYTLTFKNGQSTLTCTKTEHEHSHAQCCTKTGFHIFCNTKKCPVGYEHTHSNSCYKTSDLTITAKYQADIHSNFPIKDGDETIWWTVPSDCKSFKPGTQLGSIDTMPGENITFTRDDSESGAVIWYYVETLNGESGEYTHGGKNFKLYKKIDIEKSGYLTYTEEFHDITGFTQWWSDPSFSKMEQGGKTNGVNSNNYLCYTRNSYNLKFYNYNAYVDGKGGSVQYEAPLSSYYFAPEYPANLEKNAYVFDGWYTTAGCYEGSKADLNTMTMPASDVILYAKWTPKTHTVKTYLTKDVLDKGEAPLDTWAEVPHGTAVENPPKDPDRDPYKFVGWFYISDTGEEKAFDFSMPVNRDLNLYAKWSSNTLMEYTIRYELENGTEIAPPTTGSALAGTTKTFNAKTGTELNAGYQTGYFPEVSSHSLTMNIEGGNEFTFKYVAKTEVEYTVRYLDKATGEPVVVDGVPTPNKVVKTRDAVVTETFKQIMGYAPDAYQKQLVLAAEGNEIIFWYVKDEAHAPLQIIHWTQNIEGDGYTEYQSSTNLNAVIGTVYPETPLTIAGFTYNGTKSNASGKLTAAGLVLNLYYDRIEYPYEFRFLEQGTDKKLADAVTGNARYQAQVTQTAETIPGYTLVSAENQAINIAIEDPANVASKNVKTFYYTEQTVEIKYEVVGPTGCGTLDNYQESQLKVTTGVVKGSTPTPAGGFKFVGWYEDEACTRPVNVAWVAANKLLTPGKTRNYGTVEAPVMGYAAATYYAKFEYDVADLTITKSGAEDIDENQSFIFTVTGPNNFSAKVVIQGNGSVTIKGLKIGEYTVTEDIGWSWRYTPQENRKTITLSATEPNTVTFTNKRSKGKWLGGDAYKRNILRPGEKV